MSIVPTTIPEARPRSTDPEVGPGRLNAFSDGVLAVIITIMALELHPPANTNLSSLSDRVPALLIYALSFLMIGIYWNNHHHLFRATERIDGAVMWTNHHLLFWLSLIPVATEWVGSDYKDALPAAVYGTIALAAAIAYTIMVRMIIRANDPHSRVAESIGPDIKGDISMVLYLIGIGLSFLPFGPWLGYACFVAVAFLWFVPDRRLAL
jgi:uncharacterized membrane protein